MGHSDHHLWLFLMFLWMVSVCLADSTHEGGGRARAISMAAEGGGGSDCAGLERVSGLLQQVVARESMIEDLVNRVANMADNMAGLETQIQQLAENISAITPPELYKAAYRVFLFESPLGSYRLTLAEARELCASNNMRLATITQLEAAYRQGLNECNCGWLDDGTARFAIQYPEEWCGGPKKEAGIRFCEWQDTWNAYCFNSKDLAAEVSAADDDNQ